MLPTKLTFDVEQNDINLFTRTFLNFDQVEEVEVSKTNYKVQEPRRCSRSRLDRMVMFDLASR